jgi:hypothetical protein
MSQRTTGVPAAATNSGLMRAYDTRPSHVPAAARVASWLGGSGRYYVLDADDPAALASVKATITALRGPSRITGSTHISSASTLRAARGDFEAAHASMAGFASVGYTSKFTSRKVLFGRTKDMHALQLPLKAKNVNFKDAFPDESDVYSDFPLAAYCSLIAAKTDPLSHALALVLPHEECPAAVPRVRTQH